MYNIPCFSYQRILARNTSIGNFHRKIPWHYIYNLFVNKNLNGGHRTNLKQAFVSVMCTNEFSWSFMTLFNLYPQTNATITIIIIINTDLWLIRDHPNQLRAILVNTHALAWHYQRLEIIGCAQHQSPWWFIIHISPSMPSPTE